MKRAMKAEMFSSSMQESSMGTDSVAPGQFAGITYHANAMAGFVVVN